VRSREFYLQLVGLVGIAAAAVPTLVAGSSSRVPPRLPPARCRTTAAQGLDDVPDGAQGAAERAHASDRPSSRSLCTALNIAAGC